MAVAISYGSLMTSSSLAERVGYSFQGIVMPGLPSRAFGISVPANSPISGTFSYDIPSASTAAAEGGKDFYESIHGGFTLNALNASSTTNLLQLAADEYRITVVNDADDDTSPNPIDYMRVAYDKAFAPAPPPLRVNGVPYTGATARFKASLAWDHSVFTGPDEPMLHAVLPPDSLIDPAGLVQSGSTSLFLYTITSISRITPSLGDLNVDGKIGMSDYIEWRKAFGGGAGSFPHADANADGLVDSADYLVYRKAAALGGSGSLVPIVPEPATFATALFTLLASASSRFRRRRCA
jgi:hypothetical protein